VDDIDAGLKQRLLDADYGILSHKVSVTIPGPYDENASFALGNGKYKIDYRILYGYSLSRLYFNLSAGYRWRFGNLTDQFRYSGAIVGKITQNIRMRIKLDGTLLVRDDYKTNNSSSVPATERVKKSSAGVETVPCTDYSSIYDLKPACGGNGAGFSSDTSLTSTTEEHRNTLNFNLGMMIKFTNNFGLDISYKPAVHSDDLDQDTSYSAGIYYIIL